MTQRSFLQTAARLTALLLLFSFVLPLSACGGASAGTMFLRKTEGTVNVTDGAGADVAPKEGLGLYSGYAVNTGAGSFAWIDLDRVKLAKLDESSEIAITKEDKALRVDVVSGALFFNVTEPLAADETMEIRSSSMLVGIRGTCGWVTQNTAALLEGTISVTAGEQTVTVAAGEMAVFTQEGALEVKPFSSASVPAFVRAEVVADEKLAANVLEAAGMDLSQTELQTPRYAEAIITRDLEEVLYREWVDFAGDGDPELLILGVQRLKENASNTSHRNVWFYIFKGEDAEGPSNGRDYIDNGCWYIRSEVNPNASVNEHSCSLVEADGRLFLEAYGNIAYKDSAGREETANYYGFDAAGNWVGEHIYYMVNARGDISGSHVSGLYGPDPENRDCGPDDFAATRAGYSVVKQLLLNPDGTTVAVTAP